MADTFRWSGRPLDWEKLAPFIRNVERVAARRKADGDPLAQEPAGPTHFIVRAIIEYFLGEEWFVENVLDSVPWSYFHPNYNETDGKATEYTARIFNLAECLYHLQGTENFKYPVQSMMRDKKNIEAALAELQMGMLLTQEAVTFRYLAPSDIPGVRTPDLEISIGDRRALADVKCKYEITTTYKPGSLKSAYEDARKQIGPGNKGFVFIKVPQGWDPEGGGVILPANVVEEARRCMSKTGRIVRSVFYMFRLGHTDTGITVRHGLVELASPRIGVGSSWNENVFQHNGPLGWPAILDLIERAKDEGR